ncbi:MAG: rhaS 9 [Chryseobacterium sp.]|jgi:AraC-like DNA-binding protein|nr:rhaS 9 [Chryseobacterium sp.]
MSKIAFHNIHEILKIINKNADEKKINNDYFIVTETSDIIETFYEYPFRTDNSAIILITEGELKIQINLSMITVTKDQILIIPPNATIYLANLNTGVKSVAIVFNDSFINKNIHHMNYINEIIFFFEVESPILQPTKNEILSFKFLIDKINQNNEQERYYSKDLIYHYFNVLFLELMTIYRRIEPQSTYLRTSRKKDLIHRFLTLLTEHSRNERAVEFYAEKLSITPSYLTRIVKETSGESTRDIITSSVIIEARDMLLNSNLSINQIAEELNFSDQSFFGKFFKKKMKMSPKVFRMKNQ